MFKTYSDLVKLGKAQLAKEKIVMLHLDITAEDTRIVADRDSASAPSGKWWVTVSDNLTGKHISADFADNELAAIVGLLVGGDELGDDELSAKLYAIAEPLVCDWPRELRPIP